MAHLAMPFLSVFMARESSLLGGSFCCSTTDDCTDGYKINGFTVTSHVSDSISWPYYIDSMSHHTNRMHRCDEQSMIIKLRFTLENT